MKVPLNVVNTEAIKLLNDQLTAIYSTNRIAGIWKTNWMVTAIFIKGVKEESLTTKDSTLQQELKVQNEGIQLGDQGAYFVQLVA